MSKNFTPTPANEHQRKANWDHKYRHQNMSVDMDVWYPFLKSITFKTYFIPLKYREAEAIINYNLYRNKNMSIEVDIEENKEEINCDNNKYSEEEMLFDKSINSLFFNTTNDINQVEEKDEKEKINNDIINTKSNDDISYFENNYKNKFESPNDVNVNISK